MLQLLMPICWLRMLWLLWVLWVLCILVEGVMAAREAVVAYDS
jgi:hypothetical protein